VALSVEDTRDLWNDGNDYRPEMPAASGGEAVAQRLLRRWTTPYGFFRRWSSFGHDARQYIGDKQPLWRAKAGLENEAKKDEQVASILVIPTLEQDGTFLRLDGMFATKGGVFKFTMGITEAAGSLIALEKAS